MTSEQIDARIEEIENDIKGNVRSGYAAFLFGQLNILYILKYGEKEGRRKFRDYHRQYCISFYKKHCAYPRLW